MLTRCSIVFASVDIVSLAEETTPSLSVFPRKRGFIAVTFSMEHARVATVVSSIMTIRCQLAGLLQLTLECVVLDNNVAADMVGPLQNASCVAP